jgi:hypothetical protein
MQGGPITPVSYMGVYRHLAVSYNPPDGDALSEVYADVHIYLNENLRDNGRASNFRTGRDRLLRDMCELNSDVNPEFQFNWADRLAFTPTFSGVGSPEQCALTLQYALSFGHVTPAGLTDYCDNDPKVGVDCVGFVSNFLKAFNRYPRLASMNHFRDLRRRRFGFSGDPGVRDNQAIQPNDILYWRQQDGSDPTRFRHVAIVDSVQPESRQMTVVESSGSFNGLHAGPYTVQTVSNGIFRVHRGDECTGQPIAHVSISAP